MYLRSMRNGSVARRKSILADSFERLVRPVMHDYGQLLTTIHKIHGRDRGFPYSASGGEHVVNGLSTLSIGEECFCDVVALLCTSLVGERHNWDTAELFGSCFLALQYMRLLSEVRMNVAKGLSAGPAVDYYSWFASSARVANVRCSEPLLFDGDADVLEALMDSNSDYEIRIGFPVMERLHLLMNLPEYKNDEELRSRVEDLLGFANTRRATSEVIHRLFPSD